MNFPDDFPSVGVWKISYYNYYEEGQPVHTRRMFVDEYLGDYKLLREKTKHGWTYRIGEMDSCLYESDDGYAMRTWMDIMYLTSAQKVN